MKCVKYFLFLLLIPFIVLAEECDISNITITSIEQKGMTGNVKEVENASASNRNIYLNIKMYDVGDSITYDLTINNDSDEDYMIDEDTFKTDSDYIEYTLKTKDNTNVIKAQSTKDVTLTVTYKKEVDDSLLSNNTFNASNNLKISLNTNEKEQPLEVITTDNIKESTDPVEVKNPITSVSSMMLIIVILLTTIILLIILMKRKNKIVKYMAFIIPMILLLPTVYAICKCDIEFEANIEIEKPLSGMIYLYNELGGGIVGDKIETDNKDVWCSVSEEGYNDCMLGSYYEKEEECNNSHTGVYSNDTCELIKMYFDSNLYTYHIEPFKIARPYYIKLKVEKNIIEEVYICFELDNKTYCMQGADSTKHEENLQILEEVQSYFRYCSFAEDYSYCRGGSPFINSITLSGQKAISVYNAYEAGCWIDGDGLFKSHD